MAEPTDPSPADDSVLPDGQTAPGAEAEAQASTDPLAAALSDQQPVQGRVIGWNHGGFHVVVDGRTGFCPRSEMDVGKEQAPESLVDQEFDFRILRIEDGGKRVVLSRRAQVRAEERGAVEQLASRMEAGADVTGHVASITDFGAFIELGGVQGLLHVSEISRSRVQHPSDVLEEGQEVKVRILKIEKGGRRISLSMKALEPDPWEGIEDRFPQGTVVQGKVEKAADFGALIEMAPGLTGLLPVSVMGLPSNTSPPRIYMPGKEVTVQVISVDRRRRRISLGLEGSGTEATNADVKSYRERQSTEDSSFNALAAAFAKAGGDGAAE